MDSDYGTDIELNSDEDEEILRLLDTPSQSTIPFPPASTPQETLNPPATTASISANHQSHDAQCGHGDAATTATPLLPPPASREQGLSPSRSSTRNHDELGRALPSHYSLSRAQILTNEQRAASPITTFSTSTPPPEDLQQPPGEDPEAASRSPYDRFRGRRKALSVTDLVSNIWCEQQFEYTLTKGVKKRTPQMERGTVVHKILEEQVHTTVEITATSREDRWGLKLFNMIQGMQCLAEKGLTRELPVFGFLAGVFVQGVIDEVSYVDPLHRVAEIDQYQLATRDLPAEEQEYIPSPDDESMFRVPEPGARIAYVSDTKTRGSRSFPSVSQTRATALQLMLYHRLLVQLYEGTVDFGKLLELFSLDGTAQFSDDFVAQIAGLDNLPLDVLLEHNSMWGAWSLLNERVRASMDSVGWKMGVSYRTQSDGSMLGFRAVSNDDEKLDKHLEDVIKWWKGERGTVGVDIEDSWKCKPPSPSPSPQKPSSSSFAAPDLRPSSSKGYCPASTARSGYQHFPMRANVAARQVVRV